MEKEMQMLDFNMKSVQHNLLNMINVQSGRMTPPIPDFGVPAYQSIGDARNYLQPEASIIFPSEHHQPVPSKGIFGVSDTDGMSSATNSYFSYNGISNDIAKPTGTPSVQNPLGLLNSLSGESHMTGSFSFPAYDKFSNRTINQDTYSNVNANNGTGVPFNIPINSSFNAPHHVSGCYEYSQHGQPTHGLMNTLNHANPFDPMGNFPMQNELAQDFNLDRRGQTGQPNYGPINPNTNAAYQNYGLNLWNQPPMFPAQQTVQQVLQPLFADIPMPYNQHADMNVQPIPPPKFSDSIQSRFGGYSNITSHSSDDKSFRSELQTFKARCYVATNTGFRREPDQVFSVPKNSDHLRGRRSNGKHGQKQMKDWNYGLEYGAEDIQSLGIGPKFACKSIGTKVYEKIVVAFNYLGELAAQRMGEPSPIDYKPRYVGSVQLMLYWEHYLKHANDECKMMSILLPSLMRKCDQRNIERGSSVSDMLVKYEAALKLFRQSNRFRILQESISECFDQNEANTLIELLDEVTVAIRQCSVNIWKLRTLLDHSTKLEIQQTQSTTKAKTSFLETSAAGKIFCNASADSSSNRHIG